MNLVCLDLEGVLVPEIWKAVAAKTGIDALNRTTRDEPDYDVLMRYRLDILDQHGITLPQIQEVIGTLQPLEGAKEFMNWLHSETQVIILSDTFEEFASPLMRQLDYPTILCHELSVDEQGKILDYTLRQDNQKQKAIEAFKSLNYEIIAAGDSYNDLTMLQNADAGIFFCPPDCIIEKNPQIPVTRTYEELKATIARLLK